MNTRVSHSTSYGGENETRSQIQRLVRSVYGNERTERTVREMCDRALWRYKTVMITRLSVQLEVFLNEEEGFFRTTMYLNALCARVLVNCFDEHNKSHRAFVKTIRNSLRISNYFVQKHLLYTRGYLDGINNNKNI